MWRVLVVCSVLPLYRTGLIFKVTPSEFLLAKWALDTHNPRICRTCEIQFPESYPTHNQTPQWPSRHVLSVTHRTANTRGVILAPRLQQNRLTQPSQTACGRIIPCFSPMTPTQPSREAPRCTASRANARSGAAAIWHPFCIHLHFLPQILPAPSPNSEPRNPPDNCTLPGSIPRDPRGRTKRGWIYFKSFHVEHSKELGRMTGVGDAVMQTGWVGT